MRWTRRRTAVGSAIGALKATATRAGLPFDEYLAHLDAGEKWCTRCKTWQLRADFGADRSRGDGLSSVCRESKYIRRTSNGPGGRERRVQAAAGFAWCRGCQAWLPSASVSQGACRTHLNAEYRQHYAANPAPIRARTKARRRGLDPIPAWWATDRVEDFSGACAYGCGRWRGSWDHIWPVARGGRSAPANLVPACVSCNSRKGDRDPFPWIELGMVALPDLWSDLSDLALQHNEHWYSDYEMRFEALL